MIREKIALHMNPAVCVFAHCGHFFKIQTIPPFAFSHFVVRVFLSPICRKVRGLRLIELYWFEIWNASRRSKTDHSCISKKHCNSFFIELCQLTATQSFRPYHYFPWVMWALRNILAPEVTISTTSIKYEFLAAYNSKIYVNYHLH